MARDEDSTDKYLDQLGKSGASKFCRKWFTNKKGKQQRCAKKKNHWGKCG
jgi:hypothetical protein